MADPLPTCTVGMAPYVVKYDSWFTGLTPSEACAAAGASVAGAQGPEFGYNKILGNGQCELFYEGAGSTWRFDVENVCTPGGSPGNVPENSTVIQCGSACTVKMEVAPAPADPEKIADMGVVFGALMVATLLIFLARKFYDLFDKAPHNES